MKTAISIPNTVFEAAEQLAQKLKISRSELYSQAIKSYLEQAQTQEVTSKLNDVYENISSTIDRGLVNAQTVNLLREEW